MNVRINTTTGAVAYEINGQLLTLTPTIEPIAVSPDQSIPPTDEVGQRVVERIKPVLDGMVAAKRYSELHKLGTALYTTYLLNEVPSWEQITKAQELICGSVNGAVQAAITAELPADSERACIGVMREIQAMLIAAGQERIW